MLNIRDALPGLLQPGFATRFRWAVEERDRAALSALREEDSERYACLVAEHRASLRAIEDPDKAASSRCFQRQQRAARLTQGGVAITDAMREAIIGATVAPTEAIRVATAWWARRETPWLLLCGSSGAGKSVAAAAAVAEHGGQWFSANAIVQAFAGLFGDVCVAQHRAKEASLLVLDELGGEDDTGRMASALLQLLNTRNSAARTPVIATTNLTFEALVQRYGDARLRSRLHELAVWAQLAPLDLRPSRPQMFNIGREPVS